MPMVAPASNSSGRLDPDTVTDCASLVRVIALLLTASNSLPLTWMRTSKSTEPLPRVHRVKFHSSLPMGASSPKASVSRNGPSED